MREVVFSENNKSNNSNTKKNPKHNLTTQIYLNTLVPRTRTPRRAPMDALDFTVSVDYKIWQGNICETSQGYFSNAVNRFIFC